jgi:putative phage-type endonuclease
MIRNGLQLIPTTGMSRAEWLEKRKDGIGGSDISSILGLNHRFSAIELFYQKVGLTQSTTEENEAMFWGSRNEDKILEVGQYLDFDSGQYVDNYNSGNKLRKITKLRYMVNNPQYPWIIANLDGATNFTPRNFMMDGPAEAKAISSKTAERWTDGIPPYHIVQINTYAIVCAPMMRTTAACIFYLEDGCRFKGFRIPVIESIKDEILGRSEAFWKKVVKGREILGNVSDNDSRLRYLAEIEPAPDNSEAYYQFLSTLFRLKSNFTKIEGDDVAREAAREYKEISSRINALDNERQVHKNEIMKILHDAGANIIDFGDNGRITWNKKLYVNYHEAAA